MVHLKDKSSILSIVLRLIFHDNCICLRFVTYRSESYTHYLFFNKIIRNHLYYLTVGMPFGTLSVDFTKVYISIPLEINFVVIF